MNRKRKEKVFCILTPLYSFRYLAYLVSYFFFFEKSKILLSKNLLIDKYKKHIPYTCSMKISTCNSYFLSFVRFKTA